MNESAFYIYEKRPDTLSVQQPVQVVQQQTVPQMPPYQGAAPGNHYSEVFADENQGEYKVSIFRVEKRNNQMVLVEISATNKNNSSSAASFPVPPPVFNPQFQPQLPPPDSVNVIHKRKNSEKVKTALLCDGTVDVIGKCQKTEENGSCKILVILRITTLSSEEKTVYVPKEVLMNPSLLSGLLEEHGIIVHLRGKLSYLCEYLMEQYKGAPLSLEHKGFSFKEDKIYHSEETEIYRNACEIPDCRTRFGLCDNSVNLPVSSLLITATYSEIRHPLKKIGHETNPLIVLTCRNIDTAKTVLSKAFPNAPQIALGKQMEERLSETESNLAFIIADSGNSYFADKLVEIMDKSGSDGAAKINCLSVVVTSSKNLFRNSSDRIINMKFDENLGEHSERAVFWFMKQLISESGHFVLEKMSAKYREFSGALDADARLNDVSAPFFAALLTIFDIFISSWELDAENHRRIVETMTDYLINTNEGGTDSIVERLKSVIMKDREIPVFDRAKCHDISPSGIILVDNEKISLDNNSFAKFSELCEFEKPRNFAEALKTEGLLLTDGKLQKKVSLPKAGKSENMYCIALGRLFEYGEQIPETDEYAYGAPEVQLRLGRTNAGNPLYFTLNRTDGSQNANVYISGSSGCGKSTLLRQWARESARNGLETVIIDTDGQFAQALNNENVLVYSIGEEYGISSSASGKTLIAAANASAGLSGKQKNKLKELSCSFNKCNSLNELFASFAEKVSEDESGILENVCDALQESGVTNGKALDWNDICISEFISVLDFSALDVPNLKPLLDLILEELFAHKKAKQAGGVVTCTLILDEVQNFNLDGTSPLAASILRQGRKFGISAVMATQYLSSDDAKNIGKLLKQCESFCSFKPANASNTLTLMNLEKSDDAECCLNNLETGSAVVKGAFSTDRCSINYPVVLFVENDE